MRVNNIDNVMKVYKKEMSTINQRAKTEKKDKIEISEKARDYQFAINKAKELPDIREEKVASIKAAIEAGTYEVSAEKIADKILSKSKLISKYNEW